MNVLGLDLSCDSTGAALPDGTTHTITAPAKADKKGRRTLVDDLRRLDLVSHQLGDLIAVYRPDLCVLEDYAPGIRSAAAHRLAEMGGCVRRDLYRANTPLVLVNVMHLKVYATGKTRADKGDMRIAALKRCGIEFANDDECDAWWLHAMGLDAYGHPVVDLPKTHRDALTKVPWPDLPTLTPTVTPIKEPAA